MCKQAVSLNSVSIFYKGSHRPVYLIIFIYTALRAAWFNPELRLLCMSFCTHFPSAHMRLCGFFYLENHAIGILATLKLFLGLSVWICLHGALQWSINASGVYSCLLPSVFEILNHDQFKVVTENEWMKDIGLFILSSKV